MLIENQRHNASYSGQHFTCIKELAADKLNRVQDAKQMLTRLQGELNQVCLACSN